MTSHDEIVERLTRVETKLDMILKASYVVLSCFGGTIIALLVKTL